MTLVWVAAGVTAAGIGWGWFEAGWVRLQTLEVPVSRLPPALEGLRIAHLSDFHLGVPSRGARAVDDAVEWVAGRRPDLVCLTGDLLSRPRGRRRLDMLLKRLPSSYAVLGNHDFGVARDPFARSAAPKDLPRTTLLANEGATVDVRGCRVQLVGVDPISFMTRRAQPHELVDGDADLRILLCHFPEIIERLPPNAFHLVLAGHLHAGQICLPYPRGRIQLAHPRRRYRRGLYRRNGVTLHVSAGLGTTFVPLRFFARPEATELVLRGQQ
jgi:predicted MPP superfamily phosphohydrolase